MLTRAWAAMVGAPANRRKRDAVIVAKEHTHGACASFAIGIATDAVFGPVITFAAAGRGADAAVILPPLNARLAHDMIRSTGRLAQLSQADGDTSESAAEALARLLVQLSALACAVPWVRALSLEPVRVSGGRAEIVDARVVIDPSVGPVTRHYGHMAIHPYPVELVADVTLPDGGRLHVRPIRPEDAALESAFVAGLSEETRYFRFFYQLNELTPSMLARFTQVDYDREMAFVAIDESAGTPAIVGVARYIMAADRESAEFAIVIADAWHRRGVARALMRGLVACAKARGLSRLEGLVLRRNRTMLRFTEALGFNAHDDPEEPEQVAIVLDLARQPG
jgi:acetyltransferase